MTTNKMSTKTLVQAAFLTAISIVLTRLLSFLPKDTIRLGFGELPLMISGFLFGPIVGGISGAAADIIGMMINPMGPPHPGITISTMLWGIIPGLYMTIYRTFKRKGDPYSKLGISIIVIISNIVISITLTTYWLSQLYGRGFLILLPERVVVALIDMVLQSIIIFYLLQYLKRISFD